jgi:hypothetical protein
LAFVDHHRSLRERLRTSIARAIAPEATDTTQEITGLPFEANHLNVFVVAATSGGTGSGCVLDCSYLIQDVIHELGIRQHTMVGLLLHAAAARGGHQVHAANTISLLQELQVYSTPALGYPGDVTCGLPPSDHRPFDHTYLVQLGDPANETDLQQDVCFFAEYLYRNTLTPAQGFFQACREHERLQTPAPRESFELRSFRIAETVERVRHDIEREATYVCAAAVRKWREDFEHSVQHPPRAHSLADDGAKTILNHAKLQTDQLAAFAATNIAAENQSVIQTYIGNLVGDNARQRTTLTEFFDHIDRDFETSEAGPPHAFAPGQIIAGIRDRLQELAQRSLRVIRDGILLPSDRDSRHKIAASYTAYRSVVAELVHTEQRISSLADQVQRDITRLRDGAESTLAQDRSTSLPPTSKASPDTAVRQATCHRYCMLRLCRSVYGAIVNCLGEVRLSVGELEEPLAAAFQVTHQGLVEMDEYLAALTGERPEPGVEKHGSLRWSRGKALVERFTEHLRSKSSDPLTQLVDKSTTVRRWYQGLRREAFDFLLEDTGATGATLLATEVELLSKPPSQTALGPGYHILAMFPQAACLADLPARLAGDSRACATLSKDIRGDLFLCCEHTGLDPNAFCTDLASSHPDALDLASRVHSRIDVEWV